MFARFAGFDSTGSLIFLYQTRQDLQHEYLQFQAQREPSFSGHRFLRRQALVHGQPHVPKPSIFRIAAGLAMVPAVADGIQAPLRSGRQVEVAMLHADVAGGLGSAGTAMPHGGHGDAIVRGAARATLADAGIAAGLAMVPAVADGTQAPLCSERQVGVAMLHAKVAAAVAVATAVRAPDAGHAHVGFGFAQAGVPGNDTGILAVSQRARPVATADATAVATADTSVFADVLFIGHVHGVHQCRRWHIIPFQNQTNGHQTNVRHRAPRRPSAADQINVTTFRRWSVGRRRNGKVHCSIPFLQGRSPW